MNLANSDNSANSVNSTAQDSLLLQVLRHELEGLEMPAEGPQLEPHIIDDFSKWLATGAFDPRPTRRCRVSVCRLGPRWPTLSC